jgi:4,5-dihydroxyphthalate decarboxylase
MAELYPINMVVRDYDIMGPIAKGDIVAQDIALTLDRTAPIAAFREGSSFQAGEMSMSKYLIGLSNGDRSMVGLPVFPMRAFRHRCFFVRRDSGLHSFKDLEGKRAGTNGWTDTGNTWSRAAMRAEGVQIDKIEWWVGTIDPTTDAAFGHTSFANVPEGINAVPRGRTLQDMLIDGEIDAMMCPWPPRRFYEENGPIVRLLPDYPAIEQDYFKRVGYYPAHHIVALRREVFDEAPWVATRLFDALERSRLYSQDVRWALTDVTPWSITELETTTALLGKDWQPFGVEVNRKMIADFCEEQFAQGLVATKVDPLSAFAEFEQAMSDTGVRG